jgi:type I restriction enzyme M protein
LLAETFADLLYQDVPGLCSVATIPEIEAQAWSLNPGRYVGVHNGEREDVELTERLEELAEELEKLNGEAREFQDAIAQNLSQLLQSSA